MAIKGYADVTFHGRSGNDGTANFTISYCSTQEGDNVDAGTDPVELPVGIGHDAAVRDIVQPLLETGGVSFTPVTDSIMVGRNIVAAT